MAKNYEQVSVIISTRLINDDYVNHVRKKFSHPKTEIIVYENDGKFSLTELYNKGINESKNDIVIFMHDDLILETQNLSPKIVKLFNDNPDYGIIGIAGTDNLISGQWWQDRSSMYGIVAHIQDGKRHVNQYSKQTFSDTLKDVVVVDGLFFMVHKKRIKTTFNEEFKGFHFYDISFCTENYLAGVKIGLTTKIMVTHKSIGMVNKQWEKNKLLFEALYEKQLPLKTNK